MPTKFNLEKLIVTQLIKIFLIIHGTKFHYHVHINPVQHIIKILVTFRVTAPPNSQAADCPLSTAMVSRQKVVLFNNLGLSYGTIKKN
jgi:hypothetical protein